jgi:mannitol-1-/sugar-/sorbitol-6-/2-deoxyglucose-6-phosphatase
MTPTDAVVFDMDGILIDSEPVWQQVRITFAAEHGLQWTDAMHRAAMGCNTAGWSRVMVEHMGLRERLGWDEPTVAREIIGRLLSAFRAHLPLREGAIESVHRLVAAGYRVALASGSPHALIDHVLQATGLDQVFEATMYGDDVVHGKPAPDIYLAVLAKLGVPPDRAVGVEDSANGVRSLHAAGMGVIAAPGADFPLTPEVLALGDVVLAEMTELDAERVELAAERAAERSAERR